MAEFFVQGKPVPQGSKQYLGRGVMVETAKGLKAWRSDVRDQAQKHFIRPITGAVVLDLSFHYPRPPAHFKKNGEPGALWCAYKLTSPDLDKLVRAVGDALKGVAFVDDRQIITIHAKRLWVACDDLQGCRIRVEERL